MMAAREPDDCAVHLDGVTKRFGDETAIDRLTLHMPHGGALGLIGPNGAGKTTSLKLAMGLMKPDGGSVRVLGLNPIADAVTTHRRVGYVPEQQFIHRWMR